MYCPTLAIYYSITDHAKCIVLLSPSIISLQTILNVCHSYAVSVDLLFSPGKLAAICFGSSVTERPVTCLRIGGANIPWVTEMRYLSHIVICDLKDTKDINDKLHTFYRQANGSFSAFPGLSADKAAKLFSTYASSYYGCELWSDANASDVLAVAWQKAVRRLLQLPYTAHCNILPCLMGGLSAADIMFMMTVNFVMRNLHNVQ